MTRISVRAFERADLKAAADLLAPTHRRDRERQAVLDAPRASEEATRTAVTKQLENDRADGAVALEGASSSGSPSASGPRAPRRTGTWVSWQRLAR